MTAVLLWVFVVLSLRFIGSSQFYWSTGVLGITGFKSGPTLVNCPFPDIYIWSHNCEIMWCHPKTLFKVRRVTLISACLSLVNHNYLIRYMWFSHVEECECVSAKLWNLFWTFGRISRWLPSERPLEAGEVFFIFWRGWTPQRVVCLADFWWIISVFVDPFVMQFVQLSLCRVESQQIM